MPAPIGHNSGTPAPEQLKSIIERIERLEEEKRGLAEDIKELYAEAKGNGYDTKTIRQLVKIRKIPEADRREQEELLDTYRAALGMLSDTPLGQASISRAVGEKA